MAKHYSLSAALAQGFGGPLDAGAMQALDERYYESLVDGEPDAAAVFANRRVSAER